MPIQKPGLIWRYGSGSMPEIAWLLPTQTGTVPVGGDICNNDAAGRPVVVPDSANDDAGEELILRYLCMAGRNEAPDVMNNPGYTAAAGRRPGTANFGGYGSRESPDDRAISGERLPFLVITTDFMWVLSRDDADVIIPGQALALDRISAGLYQINDDVTADIVRCVGFYSPESQDPVTYPTPAIWVRATTPGGPI